MMYEEQSRQYFALASSGDLFSLGDCGDFDAAEEVAESIGLEVIWILDFEQATQWLSALQRGLKQWLPSEQQEELGL